MKCRIAGPLIVLLLVVPVHGYAYDWQHVFGSESNYGGAAAVFGAYSTTSDGYDPPSLDPYVPSDAAVDVGYGLQAYVATCHDSAEGWAGPSGLYGRNYRSPIAMVPGQSETWAMYVWANPDWSRTFAVLEWTHNPTPLSSELSFTLTLKSKLPESRKVPPWEPRGICRHSPTGRCIFRSSEPITVLNAMCSTSPPP